VLDVRKRRSATYSTQPKHASQLRRFILAEGLTLRADRRGFVSTSGRVEARRADPPGSLTLVCSFLISRVSTAGNFATSTPLMMPTVA
jgi:hypothetical protein